MNTDAHIVSELIQAHIACCDDHKRYRKREPYTIDLPWEHYEKEHVDKIEEIIARLDKALKHRPNPGEGERIEVETT